MSVPPDRAAASPFRLIIPPDLSRMGEVRGWLATVADRASLDETRTFDLQVAVSEAVANAIEHAASVVEIEAWLLVDRLLVEVTNNGSFRPGLYKDDEHRRRGLGLPLMASLADQVHVSRLADSRTRVSLSFHFSSLDAVGAQAIEEGPASVLARLEEESLKVAAASSRAAVLADLLERASQPFAVGLPEGGLALFNTAYADLLGYTKDELATLDWSEELTPPEWRRFEEERLSELVRTGTPVRYEKEYFRKDGTRVPVELLVHVVRDDAGAPLYYYSFITDLSERKQAARELESASRRYRALFDNSSLAVTLAKTIYDAEGRPVDAEWVEVNRLYETFTGLSPEDLVGKRVTEVLPGVDQALIDRHNEVALTGEPSSEEIFEPNLGRWFRADFYSPEYGYYVSLLSDMTAEKEAEAESERLAAQRQLALDAANLGWWHYDPLTEISSWDHRYKEIFGVTGNSRPNEEILARLHPDDLPRVWTHVEAALDPHDPQPYAAEYRIILPDGSMKWIEAHGIAAFQGTGAERRAVSLVGTVADITQRKRAQAEREQLLVQEQELSDELEA